MSNASKFLDNTVMKTTVRTDDEIMKLSVVVSKQDRASVRNKDKKASRN